MKIKRRHRHGVPQLNMASMPDLIFTVLFFFMLVTHLRTSTPLVDVMEPVGEHLAGHSGARDIYMYIGWSDGHEQVQVDDQLVALDSLPQVLARVSAHDEDAESTVIIKADGSIPMRTMQQVRHFLRDAHLLNVRYDGYERRKPLRR